ncbi:flagellar basal body P-ring formation chaperone FlgA [Hahella sp. NBU794]|uniref:flagellar basal body P-ring formation chaperone FlgA n=1 Tax=Hahella sp. NBU794 TaxID=3422590 RepID=UPI003D6FC015
MQVELSRLGAVRLDPAQDENKLPTIELSPRQLSVESISKVEIEKQLARWSSNASMPSWRLEGPDHIQLKVVAEKIDPDALEEKAGAYLKRWLVEAGFQEVEVTPVSARKRNILVSKQMAGIQVRPLELGVLSRRICVWMDIVDASGAVLNSAPVWFEVSAMGEVWTPSVDADRGMSVGSHPLKRELIDVAAAGIEPALKKDFEGKEFSKRVGAGQPITKDMLRAVPEVKNGDVVSVEVRVGTVYLRSRAEAMHDAYVGDRVKLKSVSSGETMLGVVLSAGRVWIGS